MAGGSLQLTFDDGPDPVWTPRVVRALAAHEVQATFFVIGECVAGHPEITRAVLAAGHRVALHCHRHVRHTELSEEMVDWDTRTALATLRKQLEVRPAVWRTPWGVQTAATERVAARHGLELVRWTIDTHDWRGDASPTMLARARSDLHGDEVVLLHDGLGPGALRGGCDETVALIGPLVALARRRGLAVPRPAESVVVTA